MFSFDVKTLIYTFHFDQEDNADPQHYTEGQLQKIISKPVVGIGGITFVPYTRIPVFAYREQSKVDAKIVHAFKSDAKLKLADDSLLSTFCVLYNHIRPMNNDDELKDVSFAKDGDLKKFNTGSILHHMGCVQSLLCTQLLTILPKLLKSSQMRLKFVMMSVGV